MTPVARRSQTPGERTGPARRSAVSSTCRRWVDCTARLVPVDVAILAVVPAEEVALVHAVDAAALGNADVRVRQQELAEARLVREAVHAVARGVDQHRARPVHDVAGGELAAPG